jgi:hypothetical protein
MARLEVPLIGRRIAATGDIVLRAELDLLLRAQDDALRPVTFRVDTATDMSTMPAWLARQLNLPLPRDPVTNLTHTSGLAVRSGLLRARVAGMDPIEHIFPCYFLGDPDVPPDLSQPPVLFRSLLGLTGVVDKIRLLLDGRLSTSARYGMLVVETS